MYKNSVYCGDGGTTRYNAPHIALNKIKITTLNFFTIMAKETQPKFSQSKEEVSGTKLEEMRVNVPLTIGETLDPSDAKFYLDSMTLMEADENGVLQPNVVEYYVVVMSGHRISLRKFLFSCDETKKLASKSGQELIDAIHNLPYEFEVVGISTNANNSSSITCIPHQKGAKSSEESGKKKA